MRRLQTSSREQRASLILQWLTILFNKMNFCLNVYSRYEIWYLYLKKMIIEGRSRLGLIDKALDLSKGSEFESRKAALLL